MAAPLDGMRWVRDISGALTVPVLVQYVHLYQKLQAHSWHAGLAGVALECQ
jgi:hypothetical protein